MLWEMGPITVLYREMDAITIWAWMRWQTWADARTRQEAEEPSRQESEEPENLTHAQAAANTNRIGADERRRQELEEPENSRAAANKDTVPMQPN